MKWTVIKKWSRAERREIVVYALLDNAGDMYGYTIKNPPCFGMKGFYTLYEGNREFARSCTVADTLKEARTKLSKMLRESGANK